MPVSVVSSTMKVLNHGPLVFCLNPYRQDPPYFPAVCVDPATMPELIRRQQTPAALCVMIFGPSIFEAECKRDFAWLSKADVVPFTEYFDRLKVWATPPSQTPLFLPSAPDGPVAVRKCFVLHLIEAARAAGRPVPPLRHRGRPSAAWADARVHCCAQGQPLRRPDRQHAFIRAMQEVFSRCCPKVCPRL